KCPPGEASLRPVEPLAHSLAKFGQTPLETAPYPRTRSGFLLFQHLPALIHAGLQVEVVRTAQLAGILVLGIGRLLQRVRRAAHTTPRRRCFSSGNGHNGPQGVLSEALSEAGRPSAARTGCDADKAALIEVGMA